MDHFVSRLRDDTQRYEVLIPETWQCYLVSKKGTLWLCLSEGSGDGAIVHLDPPGVPSMPSQGSDRRAAEGDLTPHRGEGV